MKLSELLNSYKGQELTAEMVTAINSKVTEIKGKAVAELTEKLGTTEKKLKEFETVKAETDVKEAFVKAGGNPEKLESFKKISGKIENLKEFKFEETFKEFPSLKAETTPTTPTTPVSAFSQIQNVTGDKPSIGDGEVVKVY